LAALEGVNLVICAGAAGVQLLSAEARAAAGDLRVAIDLNAVPPLGIEGIQVHDRAADYAGVTCYGAVGVGGMKMKVHKAAIRQLYQSNDQVLDAAAIYGLAAKLA
ncbi:MAG: bifunctional NADP-dependent methylenetetrahydromethanopterin dehydrogenase/methylenetetrahydrofolate dehydrogenase, partial [Planctomycetales bacterium]|nr:bifunctional NADP-dependent methylenetetrahydromethanopterin dehydrogenase/methylenetetrahydrofolate dehydrogenase [Planctomycetales bacterium]NIP67774.1 bifunctional NADP-dependent methylenetetrahydromethanopterin dehydrogenase/methylenetetrahydrofolate dehydrogenase [Planctomycetales bacterium]